ncbi:unnamed protein product [Pneumocystis jirovecii]|uniref:Succinate dehydrogenase [ubiquinone] cytochrome b small subunit n=1 Tax=Pneumocystis jirovecii TaxID=42068 RepID=L0P8R3_PNEJI|nr:unnamed protein product [Pneumocystis jirovecii]
MVQRNLITLRNLKNIPSFTSILFGTAKFHSKHPTCFKTSFIRQGLGPAPPRRNRYWFNPSPVPTPSPMHGSYHWTFERLISLSLVPLVMAPFVGSSTNLILDAGLSLALIVHSHIGFDTCITDYFPKREYGSFSTFMRWVLRGATCLVFAGLYEFETNDVGITEGIKRIWKA